jgi:hypothetical protein
LRSKWMIMNRNVFLWNHQTYNQYGIKLIEFQKFLLGMIHLTAGQPARGTEIVGIRFMNTLNGGLRNIFVEDGSICIYTTYHKNYTQNDKWKPIFRYLPRPIGQLLVWYLWLVIPFWSTISGCIENVNTISPYLWTSQIVYCTTSNEQSTPSSSKKLVEALKCIFCQMDISNIHILAWRHIAKAITNKFLRKSISISSKSSNHETEEEDDIWDLQAAHSTKTSSNVYARTTEESMISNATEREKFQYISHTWHKFWELHDERNDDTGTISIEYDNVNKHKRLQRLCALKKLPFRVYLRQFLQNEEANFCGEQENVLQLLTSCHPQVMYIAATGEGKSLPFMLIAYASLTIHP